LTPSQSTTLPQPWRSPPSPIRTGTFRALTASITFPRAPSHRRTRRGPQVPGKGSLGDKSGSHPATKILNPDQRISGPAEFTPDGRALVYPIRVSGVDNLWQQPIEAGAGHQITNFAVDDISAFHYSLDGKQLGVLQQHIVSDVVLLRDKDAAKP